MLAIVIAFNFITGLTRVRLDLTQEKAYTLSQGTRAILKKLDTPVHIKFYCTRAEASTPETVALRGYAQQVEDLLTEYKQAAHGKLIIEKYDPEPDSDAEDSARMDGLEGQMLPNGERFYLGLAVTMLDIKEAIPYLNPGRDRLLEYDLSRAISRVMTPDKPVVGVMSPLPIFGMPSNPMMGMGQRPSQPWVIVTELKEDFNLRTISMDVDKIDDDMKVLLLIHPREISDKAEYAIDQFILRGGKLLAFLDPMPYVIDSREQNQMLGNIPNAGSSLDKLLKAWGLTFDTTKVVADLNFKMRLGGRGGQPQEAPAVLSVTSEGIDSGDVATSQIDNVWLPYAGAFTGTPVQGLKETVLLKSTKDSQLSMASWPTSAAKTSSRNSNPPASNTPWPSASPASSRPPSPTASPRTRTRRTTRRTRKSPTKKRPAIPSRKASRRPPWCWSATPTCSTTPWPSARCQRSWASATCP